MVKFTIELLLCLNAISFIQFGTVQGDCVVRYPADIERAPIYKKHIGKYKVELPYNGNDVQLRDGETISGSCQTHFSSISYTRVYDYYQDTSQMNSENKSAITLRCLNDKLYFDGINEYLENRLLECVKVNWSIYDSNEPYDWCKKYQDSQTFLLATKTSEGDHILAGICYNLDEWSLQTVTYNVTNLQKNRKMKQNILLKPDLKSSQSLGDDLWNLQETNNFYLAQKQLLQQLKVMGESNSWLKLANYEISSIVQSDFYRNYFEEYRNILNIIWWRNLRVGNWKQFINTLENYAYNNSFQLYTGSSGVVKAPFQESGDNIVFEIENGSRNETIPAYIWTYLKSNDNSNKDFVIVGYNSPYAEFFSLENAVFCPDICSEIPWLKEIRKSFRFATAGVMFCCSPEFIRRTNFLQGFPLDALSLPTIAENQNIIEKVTVKLNTELYQTKDNETDVRTEGSPDISGNNDFSLISFLKNN